MKHHPEKFEFKAPPYEYEYKKLPMDLILGSRSLREDITGQKDIQHLEAQWENDLNQFKSAAKKVHLYE